jgi:F5/8 type C domain
MSIIPKSLFPRRNPARHQQRFKDRARVRRKQVFVPEGLEGRCLLSDINLALNPAHVGYPSPMMSDNGWGGGANKWEIVDGTEAYSDSWAHGLAFTGGHVGGPGSGGWVGAAGPRQATIDLGAPKTFHEVMIWHHGEAHTPATATVQTSADGTHWTDIPAQRHFGATQLAGPGSSVSDEYDFSPVTARYVRYAFDNRGNNVLGTPIVHGWINEFEVFGNNGSPQPVVTPRDLRGKWAGPIEGVLRDATPSTFRQKVECHQFEYDPVRDRVNFSVEVVWSKSFTIFGKKITLFTITATAEGYVDLSNPSALTFRFGRGSGTIDIPGVHFSTEETKEKIREFFVVNRDAIRKS